jgi:hypothetical protein
MDIKTIPQKLSMYGIPQTAFGALCGLSSGLISAYMNGSKPVPGDRIVTMNDVMGDLEKLIQLSQPLPLDYSNVETLRQCLDRLKDGRLRILVELSEPQIKEKSWSVRVKNLDYFVRYANGKVCQALNFTMATALTESVADEVIRKLEASGYPGSTKLENKYKPDEPAFDIEMVWK